VDNYSKTEEWKIRFEKTNMEKIGYKTNLLDPICKEKIKKSLLDKYGTENHWEIRKPRKKFKLDQRVKEMGGESDIIPSEDLYMDHSMEDYLSYRRECRRLTKKNSKVLYGLWDGSDYYDGELIRNNLYLDHNSPNYPTVDHKKSIYWGFINNVSPLLISEISNLCITKRSINSRKRDLIMDQSSN
jgi:hypothetical protein